MPVNVSFRPAVAFITLASLVYVLFYSRTIQSSQQHSSPPWDAANNRVVRSTRIVAVGDLHGDIGNAQKVLEMARVVDSEGRWSGEVDVFVQTGDIIDRYVLWRRYILRIADSRTKG
jgi:hypothetical protein